MVRLTADLINHAPHYINALKQRELSLRGHKIPQLQNLGGAEGYEAIDFTDNDIPAITNFPVLPRVKSLLLAENRVAAIDPDTCKRLPGLESISLQYNRIAELPDLDALAGFPRLTVVLLMGNPVCKKENYRYYVIHLNPTIRVLDLQKVKDAERERARELFGTVEEPTALKEQVAQHKKQRAFDVAADVSESGSKSRKRDLKQDEKELVSKAIKNAKTLAEVTQIQKDLEEGRLPILTKNV